MLERRNFERLGTPGLLEVEGQGFALADLGPGGGALVGGVWWEEDMPARLSLACGGARFTLTRTIRCCYLDSARDVTGFEFVGATPPQTDIVLGLILAHANGAVPLTVSRANTRALARLMRDGEAACAAGGWTARQLVAAPAPEEPAI